MRREIVGPRLDRGIGQHDHTAPCRGLEEHGRPETAGAAVVKQNIAALRLGDEPGEADLAPRLTHWPPLRRRQLHGPCDRRHRVHRRAQEGQQLLGGRSDRPGAGERGEGPVTGWPHGLIIALGKSPHLLPREGDDRVVHAERTGDPFRDKIRIVALRRASEQIAEQAKSEVRIFKLAADVARQLITREKVEQALLAVVGIGNLRLAARHIVRQPRQARAVGREVAKCDLAPAALGHARAGWQIFFGRIVERDFAFRDHVGEDQGGEDLRHRSDLEDRPPVECGAISRPARDDARSAGSITPTTIPAPRREAIRASISAAISAFEGSVQFAGKDGGAIVLGVPERWPAAITLGCCDWAVWGSMVTANTMSSLVHPLIALPQLTPILSTFLRVRQQQALGSSIVTA